MGADDNGAMPGPTSPSAAVTNDAAAGRPGLRVLSVIPPMTQLNTPYPSTAYLTGFLRSRGVDARQCDLALGLALALLAWLRWASQRLGPTVPAPAAHR
jgi:hypothetical protein